MMIELVKYDERVSQEFTFRNVDPLLLMHINCQNLSMLLDCSNPKIWLFHFIVNRKGPQRLFRMSIKYHSDNSYAKCVV